MDDLIRRKALIADLRTAKGLGAIVAETLVRFVKKQPTVDAYTEEQVASIIQQADKMEAEERELRKQVAWLKSCLNCKIRKECQRHCGKVVHDCDHWEYGASSVDAVEVVHGRWVMKETMIRSPFAKNYYCSECQTEGSPQWKRCPVCEAKMDGERKENEETNEERNAVG